MKEKNLVIEGIQFETKLTSEGDPLIVGVFGPEGSGKTQFPFTGPLNVGCVLYEKKSLPTVRKMAELHGCNLILPKLDLLKVSPLKLARMKEQEAKDFHLARADKVEAAIMAMQGSDQVDIVMVDTFDRFCTDVEFGTNGKTGRFKRIGDKVFQDKTESNQRIIDVMNSFTKHTILIHKHRDEWVDDKATGRKTWQGFRFLGNHCNVIVEITRNMEWNEKKAGNSRDSKKWSQYGWRYRLNVRQCQYRTGLQGAEGNPLLEDEEITFTNLASAVFPEADPEEQKFGECYMVETGEVVADEAEEEED